MIDETTSIQPKMLKNKGALDAAARRMRAPTGKDAKKLLGNMDTPVGSLELSPHPVA